MISFYMPWKHPKIPDFLMLTGGIGKEHYNEMDLDSQFYFMVNGNLLLDKKLP